MDICKKYYNLDNDVCNILLQLYAITGCDTTAYKFDIGKIRILKKVNKDPSCLHLIKDLIASIQLTQNLIEDAKRLFRLFYTMKKGRKLRIKTDLLIQKFT